MLGRIVVERDQVLIIPFFPLEFILLTFFKTEKATNGPFFKERGILQ